MIIRIKTKNNKIFEKNVRCHNSIVKVVFKEDEIIAISPSPICSLSQILKLINKNNEVEQFQKYFEDFHNSFFNFKTKEENDEQIKNLSNRVKLEIENSFKLLSEIRELLKQKQILETKIKEHEEFERILKLTIKLLYFGKLEKSEEDELRKRKIIKASKLELSKILR